MKIISRSVICLLVLSIAGPASALELAGMKGEIVFSSNRSGTWALWTIQASGAGLKQLTKPKDGKNDVDPEFSPDGKSILFTSTRGGKAGVWTVNVDGSEPKRVCDGGQAEWSPDGKAIALRRDGKIHVRTLATGKETLVTPKDLTTCSGPSWSPDGKTLAFAVLKDRKNALYSVAATGGGPVKVYDKKGACEPHWSPDGKVLLYETETHVCKVQLDGKKNRYMTVFAGVQRYPRWSPDGKYVVFCQGVSEKGPWELYIISARGGTPAKLTEEGSDMSPDWK